MKKIDNKCFFLAFCIGVVLIQACNQKKDARVYELLDSIVGSSVSYNLKSNCYYISFFESDSLRAYSVIDVSLFGYKRVVVQQAMNDESAHLISRRIFDSLMQIASYLRAELTETQFFEDPRSPFVQTIYFKKQNTIIMLYKSRESLPWKVSDVNLKNDWYMHSQSPPISHNFP